MENTDAFKEKLCRPIGNSMLVSNADRPTGLVGPGSLPAVGGITAK